MGVFQGGVLRFLRLSEADAETRRRARFVFALGVGMPPIAIPFGAMNLLQGRPWLALAFGIVAVLTFACPFWLRRGASLFVVGNSLAALFGIAFGFALVLRGSIAVPVAMVVGIV